MLGGKVENMLMGWIAQKRAALYAALQRLGTIRHVTPLGDELADGETPVGIEVIDDPIVTCHRRQLLHDVGQMGGPIRTGAGLPEIPDEMARWHHKRGQ